MGKFCNGKSLWPLAEAIQLRVNVDWVMFISDSG